MDLITVGKDKPAYVGVNFPIKVHVMYERAGRHWYRIYILRQLFE